MQKIFGTYFFNGRILITWKKLIIYSLKIHYLYLAHLSHICLTKINDMYTDILGLQDVL